MATPTKKEFREKFQRAKTTMGRFRVFVQAACSGRWEKCQGRLADGEKRCVSGLIMDLDGAEFKSGIHAPTYSSRKFLKLVGFNPFAYRSVETFAVAAPASGEFKSRLKLEKELPVYRRNFVTKTCLVDMNDDRTVDVPLCELSKIAKGYLKEKP